MKLTNKISNSSYS